MNTKGKPLPTSPEHVYKILMILCRIFDNFCRRLQPYKLPLIQEIASHVAYNTFEYGESLVVPVTMEGV